MEILESVGVYQGLLQNTNAICPGWTLFKLRRQGVKRDCCVKSNSRNDLLDLHLLNPRHWNSQQHQRRSSPVWQYMLESSFYADQKQGTKLCPSFKCVCTSMFSLNFAVVDYSTLYD